MLWHILKHILCFAVPVYYRRVQIKNADKLRIKEPVIIAMNHPNAFMDPIAFTVTVYPPKVMYLARGDVFKPGLISRLLESIGIVPIFRIQDAGKEGLKKNDETFRRVNYLLGKNNKIIVFAEGLCIQERRLRTPLKKGVPRMIFGAVKETGKTNIMVVPVGVNYSKPSRFRSNVFFNIGDPIKISDYLELYEQTPAKAMNKLLQDLEPKMKELIVHIQEPSNDQLVEDIEEIYKRDWCRQEGLNYKNLEHDLIITDKIVQTINEATRSFPEKIAVLKDLSRSYLQQVHQLHLRDWLLNPANQKRINLIHLSARFILLVFGLPIYFLAILTHFLPYKGTNVIAKKLAKHIEFHASMSIGVGSFLFPINYMVLFFVVYYFSPHIGWPILSTLILLFSGWFYLVFHPFLKKTFGMWKYISLNKKNKSMIEKLKKNRAEIIAEFQSLCAD